MTDAEARVLCGKAQAGDVEAAQQLAAAHRALAFLVAKDWIQAYHGAAKDFTTLHEDLQQTAIVIMLEEVIPHFRVDGRIPFRSFARRKISAGLWRDLKFLIRRNERFTQAEPQIRSELHAPTPTPEELYAQAQVPNTVARVLHDAYVEGKLSFDQLRVLHLSAHGHSPQEIVRRTGFHRNRVYRLISGARAKLRGEFFDE